MKIELSYTLPKGWELTKESLEELQVTLIEDVQEWLHDSAYRTDEDDTTDFRVNSKLIKGGKK